MPAESCIDFYFQSAKSSATAMVDWIEKLTVAVINSKTNEFAKVDLKRACQLVLEDARGWRYTENAIDNAQKLPPTMDALLGTVMLGSIFLNGLDICCEALTQVAWEVPVSQIAHAIMHFGVDKLQPEYVSSKIQKRDTN